MSQPDSLSTPTVQSKTNEGDDLEKQYVNVLRTGIFMSYEQNYITSIQYYKQAALLKPRDYRAHFHIAVGLCFKDNLFYTITHFSDYLNLNQKSRSKDHYMYTLANCDYPLIYKHIILGCIYELEEPEKAKEEYAAALKIDPNNYHAAFYYGSLIAEDKKYEEAIPYFTTASNNAIFSNCVVLAYIGWAYKEMQKPQEAIPFLLDSLKAYPRCYFAISTLIHVKYDVLKEYDEALELCKGAYTINRSAILFSMANIYFYQGKHELAYEYYTKSLLFKPSQERIYHMLAYIEVNKVYKIQNDEEEEEEGMGEEEEQVTQYQKEQIKKKKLKEFSNRAIEQFNVGINQVLEDAGIKYLKKHKQIYMEHLNSYQPIDLHPEYAHVYDSRFKRAFRAQLWNSCNNAAAAIKLKGEIEQYKKKQSEKMWSIERSLASYFTDVSIITVFY